MKNTVERRHLPQGAAGIEVRERSDGTRQIYGLAAVFDRFSEILGDFVEIIKPGAFRKALEISDPTALFNHEVDNLLGRRSAGTLRVAEERQGLGYEVDMDNTPIAEFVLAKVQRRELIGNSFAFVMFEDGDEWSRNDEGLLVRTILPDGIAELVDVGPVVNPAYKDTVVSARALEMARDMKPRTMVTVASGLGDKEKARERAARQRRLKIAEREIEALLIKAPEPVQPEPQAIPRFTPEERQRKIRRAEREIAETFDERQERQRRERIEKDHERGRRTAFHEAGHALAAVLTGIEFDDVCIDHDGRDYRGTGRIMYRAEVIPGPVHLAGAAALRVTGQVRPDEGAGSDWAAVTEYPDHALRAAVEMLSRERFALEALERELFLRGRLTADEVRSIVLPLLTPQGRREAEGPSYSEMESMDEARYVRCRRAWVG